MTVFDFCVEIEKKPGGLDYFYSWVKSYLGNSEKRIALLVIKFFNSGGYIGKDSNESKPSKKSEDKFMNFSKDYLNIKNKDIVEEIEGKEVIIHDLKKKFQKILSSPGGFFFFYGWIRAKYGENYKTLSRKKLDKYLLDFEYIKKCNFKDYKDLHSELGSVFDRYLNLNEEGAYILFENIPSELIVPFKQYFLYFNDFVRSTKNEDVEIIITDSEKGLKINIPPSNKGEIDKIENYLKEYIEIAKLAIVEKVEISSIVNNLKGSEIAILQFESQLSHLKLSLKLKDAEIKYLSGQNDFLKSLTLKLVENSKPGITNQIITDGHQQFADNIINSDKS